MILIKTYQLSAERGIVVGIYENPQALSADEIDETFMEIDDYPRLYELDPNKSSTLYINPQTKEMWYEYNEVAYSLQITQLQEKITNLEAEKALMQQAIDDIILGGTL